MSVLHFAYVFRILFLLSLLCYYSNLTNIWFLFTFKSLKLKPTITSKTDEPKLKLIDVFCSSSIVVQNFRAKLFPRKCFDFPALFKEEPSKWSHRSTLEFLSFENSRGDAQTTSANARSRLANKIRLVPSFWWSARQAHSRVAKGRGRGWLSRSSGRKPRPLEALSLIRFDDWARRSKLTLVNVLGPFLVGALN